MQQSIWRMPGVIALVGMVAACSALLAAESAPQSTVRPPAVPLVTSDPYLSIWSCADKLTDDVTRHWTKREHSLVSLIRIDGTALRLMGHEPKALAAMPQVALRVLPTRSIYEFDDGHVHVTLTFMTPALPEDLDVLARPVTYLTWSVRSVDNGEHTVSIYDGTSGQLAVNEPAQQVQWQRSTMGPLTALRIGTVDQTILRPAGDDTRIDWGYAYAAAHADETKASIGAAEALEKAFADGAPLPPDDAQMPRPANAQQPAMGFGFDVGKVGALPVERHLMVGYDEIYAIQLLGQKLRPYWRRNGAEATDLFQAAEIDYHALVKRCAAFDDALMADLEKTGGRRYAEIAALAYRQGLAGCGLAADAHQQPMLFTKENTSNGCIATVDVIYPAAPQFLLMGPTYAKALVVPAMVYSQSPRWKFPFAPHDLGVYPQANAQVYGGGENSTNEADMMPVEESANLILLCDAIARMDGNADFSARFWPQLTQWENYLEKYGLDPENQLCTDDFMGHLAHNANLSVKAILAIAAYGDLCRLRGDTASADKYLKLAREDAKHWIEVAADAGDHYRIAFDKPNTWSQKYNLVWDQLLGLKVFPPDVAQREVAFYKTVMQRYGLPLDSRTKLTKTDWSLWSATMADSPTDFEAIVSPIYDYLGQTTARSPFVDSYETNNIKSDGMHARPVIGGVFIKMLADGATWKRWASRDRAKVGDWAPTPRPPQVTEVVPASQHKPVVWRYTTRKPPADWTNPTFDASAWEEGPAGFGTKGTPGAVVNTVWKTSDIWLRREVTIPAGVTDATNLQLSVYHDEDVEIYVNGSLAAKEGGYVNQYQLLDIAAHAREQLKPGAKVALAVHCHQTTGGQGVDVGIVNVVEGK
jgi:hypothetical protein